MKKIYFAAVAMLGICTMATLNANAADDQNPQTSNLGSCNNYAYYLADNQTNSSDIYRVDIVGTDANLTWLKSLEYTVHIAHHPTNDSLYIVRASNGAYRALDVSAADGFLSSERELDQPVIDAVAVDIDANGTLFIGGAANDMIVEVDIPTGTTTPFATADINGGDLAFGHDGVPYLATRGIGGALVSIAPGNNQVIGGVSTKVTGLAITNDGDFLYSALNSSKLTMQNADGSASSVYFDLKLNGASFEASNGDLAYGCSDSDDNTGCADFSTYYINHGPGVSGSDLYRVDFSGSDAVLTHILNVSYQVHMGMDAQNGVIYLVNANGNFIEVYDISTGSIAGSIPITGDINTLYAVVFNPNNGILYVGDSNDNEVYEIDVNTGIAQFYAEAPIQGGDIVFQNGILYCAQRDQNKLHTVVADADGIPDGIMDSNHIGSLPDETNGMAAANNTTSLFCAPYGTTTFQEISNVDGTVLNTYNIILDGQPFSIRHGDMASGCGDDESIITSSCDYKLYYTHQAVGSSADVVYEVQLHSNGSTTLTDMNISGVSDAHIALSPDGGIIYFIQDGGVRQFDISTNTMSASVDIHKANGQSLSGFPTAVCGSDGTLYVGGGQNAIYTVAADGLATPIATGVGVSGGDLFFANEELWLIRRDAHEFRNITTPANSFTVAVNEINGAALLPNGNVIVANGNGEGLFREIDLTTQSVVDNYDTGLPLYFGDLAGGCTTNNPSVPPTGACYATEVFGHIQGTSLGGGAVATNRTNPLEALGEPERVDQLVFLSLGYGGEATFTFDGAVLNGPGDDLEIVETTYGNMDCGSYYEFADISVSQDGVNYVFAKTVCRSDAFVDLSDNTSFEYITHVKVSNSASSVTPDGYDLDGIVAIHNCENGAGKTETISTTLAENASTQRMSTFPNPTSDESNITFESDAEGKVTLELYNTQGRVIATIANISANTDQAYTYRLDTSDLPNGIYIYKLTTPNGVSTQKLMVTH